MQKENSFFFSFSNESTFDRGQRYFRFQVLMVQGFLNKGTGLYGQGADDGGDDGADNLQHLEYFLPVDFHFTQNYFEDNTLFIKSPAEIKEIKEIMAAHDNLNDILQRRKISFISFISAGQKTKDLSGKGKRWTIRLLSCPFIEFVSA